MHILTQLPQIMLQTLSSSLILVFNLSYIIIIIIITFLLSILQLYKWYMHKDGGVVYRGTLKQHRITLNEN